MSDAPDDVLHVDLERRGYPSMEVLKQAIHEAVDIAVKPLREDILEVSRFVRGDGSAFNNGIEGEVHRIRVDLEEHMSEFQKVKLKVDRAGWVLLGGASVGGAVGALVASIILERTP